MLRPPPSPGRLLLLLPTATYRTTAFVEAARRLRLDLTVASEQPSTFEQAQPDRLLTLDFSNPERAAEQAAVFARGHPIAGVVGVDDTAAIVAAAIGERLGLAGNPPAAALASRDKPDPLNGPFFEETIYVTPSRLPKPAQRAIAGCAQAAVAALGLREGPIHAELRWNTGGAWLIELAARPIGGRCSEVLRFTTGEGMGQASLEEVIVRHAVGLPIPSLEREQCAAGVMMIPVTKAGVLREVRGVAEARAVPLVEDVAITAYPSQALMPWPEGSRYPGFIFARGGTPAAVEAALREAHRRLASVITPPQPS